LGVSDFLDYEGEVVPASVKDDWLQQITEAGGQTGKGMVEFTPISFAVDRLGIQFTTIASGTANLNPDAAELFLYGNAGRTGSPQDYVLDGAGVTGFAVSTIALSIGIPVSRRWVPGVEQGLAFGFTVKQSFGHALLYAEEKESTIQGDPIFARVEFPMIYPSRGSGTWGGGSGLGVDVGVSWKRDSWALAGVIKNGMNTFKWDIEEMSWRRGRIFMDEDSRQTIVDEQNGQFAPQSLKTKVKNLTFKPSLTLAGAYSGVEDLTITAEVRRRAGEGLDIGPKAHAGLGLQYAANPSFPIHAGAAVITDGFQAGGGFGLTIGRVQLGVAALYRSVDTAGSLAGMVGISVVNKRDEG
jgi:hypothetical protein